MNGQLSTNNSDIVKENLRLQCISIFIEAYKISSKMKGYDNDWDEDQFTAYLFQYIEEQPLLSEHQWFVNPQTPVYTEDITSGRIHASKAKKPDIKFSKYHPSLPQPFSFYIEAKNLSESDWQKKCGSKVESCQQRARYIDIGIKHFKEGIYPDGCLAGYIVQGTAKNSIFKLNELLKRRNRKSEILIRNQFIIDFYACYISNHPTCNNKSIQLKHIFLEFLKND